MTTKRKGTPKPTWTSLVLDALVKADDFMTVQQIRAAVNAPPNGAGRGLIGVTLKWLHGFHAVESVVGADGKLWWFATPGDDQRTKQLLERVPEDQPRKRGPRRITPKEPT